MLHGLNHPGIRDTLGLISTPYAWLFMNKNLRCGADRVRIVNGPRSFAILRRPSCHFVQRTPDTIMRHIDIVGPLSSSHGFTCILTCVNPFPRWPEAQPLLHRQQKAMALNINGHFDPVSSPVKASVLPHISPVPSCYTPKTQAMSVRRVTSSVRFTA